MKKYFVRGLIVLAIVAVAIIVVFYISKHVPGKNDPTSKKALPSEIAGLMKNAEDLEQRGDLLLARQSYQSIQQDYQNSDSVPQLRNKIWDLNVKLLFSRTATPDSQIYVVEPGDSLVKISKKFNTTAELIKKANNLNSDNIKVGAKLKVQTNKFSIVADKSQNTLTLFSNGEVFKIYNVSTGKNNCTPVGKFKIVNKLVNPPWFSAKGVIPAESPENVLGTRWLGIDVPGYGIHGTTDPASIGTQCTEGCIRLKNAEVEELYAIVPMGTEVTIVD